MIPPETLANLARLLGVEAGDLQAEPLPGGISNRSWLLTCRRDRWAVRLASACGVEQVLAPDSEARVLATVAEAGLTPEMRACDPDSGVLITRYLERTVMWTAQQARDDANIDRIATTLRRLHNLRAPADLRVFRPTELARVYSGAALRAPGVPGGLRAERLRWSQECERLAQAYEAAFAPTALCHNDLVAANIVDDGRLWLLDFEYAVRADPVLDLAGFAGLNGLARTQRRRLLQAYYGLESAPIANGQFDGVIRLVQLIAFFWSLARADGRSADDQEPFADAMAAVLR